MLEMADIGDVAHIAHLVAQMTEQFAEYIEGYTRTGVAQMGIAINGWTAHIHSGMAGVNGLEDLLPVGHCIGKSENSH